MTEELLRKSTKDYFERRSLSSSPCYQCSNFIASVPGIGRKPFACAVMERQNMQKYFRPDAPDCPKMQEGEMRVFVE